MTKTNKEKKRKKEQTKTDAEEEGGRRRSIATMMGQYLPLFWYAPGCVPVCAGVCTVYIIGYAGIGAPP